jgi:type I restriction enzyme S subunit
MKLGDLCEVVRGSSPRPKGDSRFYGGSVPRLMVADVTRDGKYVTPKIDSLTPEGAAQSRPMKKGDLVIAVSGNPGLPAILEIDACIHDGFVGLRNLNTSKVFVDYLYCYLSLFKEEINNKAVGAIFKNLTTHQIAAIDIPLPPIAEQKRIAAILDRADAIRRKRQQAIVLTEELLRSAFLEMFGDPITNPKGWQMEPLGNLCTIRRGASPRPIDAFLGGSVPWIKIGDATESDDIYIRKTAEAVIPEGAQKSVYLEPGSLIFANCGVSLGFARILAIGGCIHDGWLSLSEIHPCLDKVYLLKLINSITNHFRQIAPSGTQPNLNTGIMKGFCIPVPPIDLQREFSESVVKISLAKQRYSDSLDSSENLFNSLLQRAFRGEL